MLPFNPHNPDHLVALISGFRENNTEDQRRKPSKKGAILDSLAHLAICKAEKQVISIGAVEKQVISATGELEDCLEILVADNRKVDDSVPAFLTESLKSLVAIRLDAKAAVIEASLPSLSSAIHASPLLKQKLANLELSAVLHNLPKICARSNKRYGAFRKFITHINDSKHTPPQCYATHKHALDDIAH